MATSFPHDRFDDLPDELERVGAHRVPRKSGRGWIAFGWAVLATAVLIGVGVFGLNVLSDQLGAGNESQAEKPATAGTETPAPSAETPVEEPPAPAEPVVDPALPVTVLNGTAATGLAGAAGDLLAGAGWTIASRSNAATEDVTVTTVYYSDPALEPAARGILLSLPNAVTAQSQDFADLGPTSLVVVVGTDYASLVE